MTRPGAACLPLTGPPSGSGHGHRDVHAAFKFLNSPRKYKCMFCVACAGCAVHMCGGHSVLDRRLTADQHDDIHNRLDQLEAQQLTADQLHDNIHNRLDRLEAQQRIHLADLRSKRDQLLDLIDRVEQTEAVIRSQLRTSVSTVPL